MNTFITGATGFIGGHLAGRLSRGGHNLTCLVRKMSPAAEYLKQLGATLVTGDVNDRASVLRGMAGCGWVVHLAGVYSFWEPDNRVFAQTNVEGTRNVMESALETGVSKIVHVSTVGVYGKPADYPFTEESPVGPVRYSKYFRTKYEGEQVVWDLYHHRGLPVVVVYPCAVLGPGDTKATGQYISSLVRRQLPATAFDDSMFTFVDVRDVAEAIVRAAEKPGNLGQKYLVGATRMTFGELARMACEIAGVPRPRLHFSGPLTLASAAVLTGLADLLKRKPLWGMSTDQMKVMQQGFAADGSKAERELGLRYTPIRTTLEEAVASYR